MTSFQARFSMMLALALVLAGGLALPAGALADKAAGPTHAVIISGDRVALDDIKADRGFTLKYDWPEFGMISGSVGLAKYAELRTRGDILVEDDLVRTIQCHNARHGCDDGGGSTSRPAVPSDQTPYGIEQIYNSATITATSGGAGTLLGHFDTGILPTHVDLVNRVVACLSAVSGGCEDKNGHGTHTAGTAAADAGSDKKGIYGVAPEASIYTVKVCSNGGLCSISDTIEAIDLCISAGCHVITFSIGGNSPSESERTAIQKFNAAGGLFVAAAGNDGPGECSIDYPGGFKETLGIAALNVNKEVASFSSRGCNSALSDPIGIDGGVDFAAGGRSVESTWSDGKYNTISGTSMATPHVSGLALKKWAGDRTKTISALKTGVEDITKAEGTSGGAGSGVDIASGFGLPHV